MRPIRRNLGGRAGEAGHQRGPPFRKRVHAMYCYATVLALVGDEAARDGMRRVQASFRALSELSPEAGLTMTP